MGPLAGLLALLCLIAGQLPGTATAQLRPGSLATEVLVDPLDGHVFEVQVMLSTNGLGGYDSDGCAYAGGQQPRAFAVATSPTTLYSALVTDWKKPIPPERKTELMALLLGIGEDVDDARALRPSQSYEIAAVVSEFLGGGPYASGELYLQGAWTIRDTIVGFLPGVQGSIDAWQKLTSTLPQVRELENPRGRTIALFDMARLCHRGGFVLERDAFLKLIDSFEDAGLGAQEKRQEFYLRVAEESRLLSKAREAFMLGLKERRGTPDDQAYYRYLVGELSRRLGDYGEADSQLEAVRLGSAGGEEVQAYVMDVQAVLKMQGRTESAVDLETAKPGESSK